MRALQALFRFRLVRTNGFGADKRPNINRWAQPGPGNVRSDRYATEIRPMQEAESDYSGPEMLLDHWSEAVSYRLESYTDESEPLSTPVLNTNLEHPLTSCHLRL